MTTEGIRLWPSLEVLRLRARLQAISMEMGRLGTEWQVLKYQLDALEAAEWYEQHPTEHALREGS